jgi:uncharacterized membrane protein YphA (DoxX/SURF4 family)
MKLLHQPWLHRLLAVLLGLLFVYASHDKIWKRALPAPAASADTAQAGSQETGPAAFARIIYRYQVVGPDARLPPLVANLVAVTLPWVELLVGLSLITGLWRREAAFVVALLLLVFVLAVGSTLWRGIDIQNCGCFSLGADGRQAGLRLVLGDLGLLLAALWVAFGRCEAPRKVVVAR